MLLDDKCLWITIASGWQSIWISIDSGWQLFLDEKIVAVYLLWIVLKNCHKFLPNAERSRQCKYQETKLNHLCGTNALMMDERLSMTMGMLDDCRQAHHNDPYSKAYVRDYPCIPLKTFHNVCELKGLSYGATQCILSNNLHISVKFLLAQTQTHLLKHFKIIKMTTGPHISKKIFGKSTIKNVAS